MTAALKQVLSGTYASGVTLDSAGYANPITVTGTIDVSQIGSGGIALNGAAPVAWTVDNQGLIEISGTLNDAVRLGAGGAMSNTGTIIGSGNGVNVLAQAGSVTNAGAIIGTSGAGALLAAGGTVSNAAGGVIGGSLYGVEIEGTLRAVYNAGLINASNGTAVLLHASGAGAAYVGNGGSITGSGDGIDVADTSGTVTNSGDIAGGGGYGVRLALAGGVTNTVSGAITGAGKDAVHIDGAGQVFNHGSIGATGNDASGVSINGPGSVYNVAGGVIRGPRHGAAVINGPGTITNAGSIISNNPTTGGAALDGGGVLTNQAGGYIAGGYGVYVFGGGTITNAGTIKSNAGVDTAVDFVGGSPNRLIVDAGAVFVGVANGGNAAGATAVSVLALAGTGGSLAGIGSDFVNFGSIAFYSGAAWTIGGTPDSLAAGQPISGFARGDTIELDGVATTGSAFQNGKLTLANGLYLNLPGANYEFGQFQVTNDGTNTDVSIDLACFAAGTCILTAAGEIAVEALRPGAPVVSLTHRRLVRVKWVGARAAGGAPLVRIAPGAFGAGMPHRALQLSPDHAVFAAGALLPVRHLVNGGAIAAVAARDVVYFHVELEEHAVLVADGLPAESYLDTGNRAGFLHDDATIALTTEANGDERLERRLPVGGRDR